MKEAEKNIVRLSYLSKIKELFEADGEDVGIVDSHTINFPIVYNGEESVIEIVVKIPKYDGDELYAKREAYQMKLNEKAEKKAEKEKEKAKKIERDNKKRAEKAMKTD